MMKPEFYKPFDLAHAKAGAPVCGASGEAVRILIWDRKHPTHPIIAIEEHGEQEAVAFRADGTATHRNSLAVVSMLVMLPLGLIDGKPVFVGDELATAGGGIVKASAETDLKDGHAWRWPAPPRVYPVSQMTFDEFHIIVNEAPNGQAAEFAAIANAALRHAVESGQLVEPGDRAARDMAVAVAVRNAAQSARPVVRGYALSEYAGELAGRIALLDLVAIIASLDPAPARTVLAAPGAVA